METLSNCKIIIDIECINQIISGNQVCEIYVTLTDQTKCKIKFDYVWDYRCAIENAYINRASRFSHAEKKKSSMLLIENSNYIYFFEEQVCGTRSTKELKNYILFDKIDTVIEVLTEEEPELIII